jgi:hypothetical protein
MKLLQRAQDILLKPKEIWPAIAQEGGDVASIYATYLIFLAAIPAVAGFIGMSLVGGNMFGTSVRVPLVSGLVNMVVGYVLSLVMMYVLALVVDALAPIFGGTKNSLNAFKLVAYAATAGMLGGIFSLLPMLSILGLLASLYSVYLIYLGLPVLMQCPQEKALAYTAVLLVCAFVAALILGSVSGMLMPTNSHHI